MELQAGKRVVVKIGTSIVASGLGFPDASGQPARTGVTVLESLVEDIGLAMSRGHQIIVVSSGAIGAGIRKLKWNQRPTEMNLKQAAASVGQVSLMQAYDRLFAHQHRTVAQVLLTRRDFENRVSYLNARATITALLELGVVPIINENDTVAVDEIKFGDNDSLSALVASKMDAELLVMLTDVDGLYGRGGEVVRLVEKITPEIERMAGKKSASGMGTGGMSSKIDAAKISTASGVTTIIASGLKKGTITDILDGVETGTTFVALSHLSAKEKWILFGARARGEIWVDSGAESALRNLKRSLLPAGVVSVRGTFDRRDVVKVKTEQGTEFARGVSQFSSEDIEKIKGKKSAEVHKILKTSVSSAEIVHRDALVIIP